MILPSPSEHLILSLFQRRTAAIFCVDYSRCNAKIVRDSYPIMRMDECIKSLDKARMFLRVDASSGYWQIRMDDKDVGETAYHTQHWLFKYTQMSFGLRDPSATFRRALNVILA